MSCIHLIQFRAEQCFSRRLIGKLNVNISHHDNSEEIAPSKGFEKVPEVGVMKHLKVQFCSLTECFADKNFCHFDTTSHSTSTILN